MKKNGLITLMALITLSFTVSAQNRGNRGGEFQRNDGKMRWSATERAENMAKQLELTETEKAKVIALFEKQDEERNKKVEEQRSQREALRNDREARRAEMLKLREKAVAENDAELEKVIGKEKLEQWKEYRTELQKKRRDINRQDRRPDRR